MASSKVAIAADRSHARRIKKLAPKARFKSLSKTDQVVVTARALAHELDVWKANSKAGRGLIFAYSFTISKIKPELIEFDPVSGWLTRGSIEAIKLSLSRTIKRYVGKDAMFMFTIEQQDKDGIRCEPHVHGIVNLRFVPLCHRDLTKRLQRFADDDAREIVQVKKFSRLSKMTRELALSEADYRRLALYAMKNEHSEFYRSKPLMAVVHERFEFLKRHSLGISAPAGP